MKILTAFITPLFISLTLFNVTQAQQCNYGWDQQNSGTSNTLYTCKAVNEMVCWAAGSGATVRRTTNGGTTWLDANPNPGVISGTIYNMEAIDANTAWVTTEASFSTVIYKTSNGGDNWSIVYSNTDGFIKGVRMYDTMNGIAVGSPVSGFWNVILTTDGGNTWHASPNPPAAQFIHQAVHNSFQIEGPNIYWGTSITSIFRSTNSGGNYTEDSTPGAGIYVFALRFNSNGFGLVAGTSMSRSTDGGVTFQPHSTPGAGNINGIESAGNDFWYVRGTKIYYSTDNGADFAEQFTAPQSVFYIDLADNISGCQTGWAVGVAGNIYKLTNSVTGVINVSSSVPDRYSLGQNYPNPFNPTTNLNFKIKNSNFVRLSVYDISGKEVAVLVNGILNAGEYIYTFNGENLSSGVYFYRLVSDGFTAVRKMTLIK
ncbi:MAG: T9SS type A sorting domain-containing protein [Ignavibacteriae bacterium]|nr:T9SS type A sorting domain-containing protein [Ignavibacteriota bacterium]